MLNWEGNLNRFKGKNVFEIIVLIVLLFSSLYPYSNIEAQQARREIQENYIHHIYQTEEEIRLDGIIDENIWKETIPVTDFWMTYPIDQQKAAEDYKTLVRVTYDDQFLYVAAICHGPGPYLVQSLKRDGDRFWDGDTFAFVIDPVNERSYGFNFATNPSGVQFESLVSGQTGRRGGGTSGFNTAWNNKWYVETKVYEDHWTAEIAIPFKTLRFGPNRSWGINYVRGVARENSYHTWAPVPREFYSVDLGYTGVLQIEKLPAKSKSNISVIPYALGSTFKDYEADKNADHNIQVGGDAKIAITSNINLDVTINPDFSQVEVDRQVTNLTTVNIRFPEQRLFFLENADIFSDFGIPPMRPFFSRRLGLDEDGNTVPILYGARLSGNANPNLRIGAMNLQTKEQEAAPGQNYTSVALHQRVLARSTIKGYFHNRQGLNGDELALSDFNRTMGMEFDYRTADGRWQAFGGYGLSFSDGINDDNYFYNTAFGYNSRNIGFYTNVAGVGNNYIADMGFIPRINHYDAVEDTTYVIGFHHSFTRFSYTFYAEKNPRIISHTISLRNVMDYTKDNWNLIGNRVTMEYELLMTNTSGISLNLNYEAAGLLYPFAFTDDAPLPVDNYYFGFAGVTYRSDQRKKWSYEANVEYGGFYNGTRSQIALAMNYRREPWGNFGLTFVQNNLDFPDPYGSETLLLIGPRMEINFSRDLFWTTFLQYNTQTDNFNINSRIQWRFQPLSDIFLVYTDNYAVEQWGVKNRAIVLKLNYWINL